MITVQKNGTVKLSLNYIIISLDIYPTICVSYYCLYRKYTYNDNAHVVMYY